MFRAEHSSLGKGAPSLSTIHEKLPNPRSWQPTTSSGPRIDVPTKLVSVDARFVMPGTLERRLDRISRMD
jgi:hypothetical protein